MPLLKATARLPAPSSSDLHTPVRSEVPLNRVRAGERQGTFITAKLTALAEVLPEMVQYAKTLPDPSGWETLSPGVGFNPLKAEQVVEQPRG